VQVPDSFCAEPPLDKRGRLEDNVVMSQKLVPLDPIRERPNSRLVGWVTCRKERVERRGVYERRQWR
jgi:hypothetical protein